MTERTSITADKPRQWWLVALATMLLTGVFAVLWLLDSRNTPQSDRVTEQRLPVVSVIESAPATHRATIVALSEAKARHSAVLRSQTAGQIVALSDDFLPGQKVRRGTVLLQVQDDTQRTMVAEASNRQAQAKLALLTEERTAITAEANWKRSANGEQAPAPLVLREPQLEAARAEQQAAAAALEEAKIRLRNTAIRAPFDGVIDARDVSLGETIDVGQAIGIIVDQETIDVTVHLNSSDWSLLPDTPESLDVSLGDPVNGHTWPAVIRAQSGVVDESTRLRRLYLVHQRDLNSDVPLLPGTFVQVSIPGVAVDNTLQVPDSALTRDSTIWSVDDDDRLVRHEVTRVFSRDGSAFVSVSGFDTGALRVAVHPLAGFVVGDRVNARTVETPE